MVYKNILNIYNASIIVGGKKVELEGGLAKKETMNACHMKSSGLSS
ncbi:hypothetical protein B8V81_4712 [Paenibacillus pasadenensis]|uniref:Uncharacterized protein n=1 Tax=Paenibacillus pasadenensis TaxID=217090 RepID=A0A2N5N7F1_9BACL|nr:hypothetical protein B8V81_4712 [Paenibacillus pasadenensis]